MTDKIDVNAAFVRLMERIFPRYRGISLEVKPNGYEALGKHFDTLDDLDRYMDEEFKKLGEGINKPRNRLKNEN